MEDFNFELDRCLQIITDGIAVFQNYEDTKYQKILSTKHNTLIYYIENNIVKVIRILQNFQNPEENYDSVKDL
ncbi:hypothetical protein [Chryseobacterium sp. Leaf394]|uniref:hypothetical protein n=1 Tax=Chryseobacterium sp. Leaf394 TaxID=1736361 RepID=UPI000FF8B065|nr:hypothetical protein [Chryseobacterium sp. Leaf394]